MVRIHHPQPIFFSHRNKTFIIKRAYARDDWPSPVKAAAGARRRERGDSL